MPFRSLPRGLWAPSPSLLSTTPCLEQVSFATGFLNDARIPFSNGTLDPKGKEVSHSLNAFQWLLKSVRGEEGCQDHVSWGKAEEAKFKASVCFPFSLPYFLSTGVQCASPNEQSRRQGFPNQVSAELYFSKSTYCLSKNREGDHTSACAQDGPGVCPLSSHNRSLAPLPALPSILACLGGETSVP